MVQGKLFGYGDNLSEVYNIRKQIIKEEPELSALAADDKEDEYAVHAVVYDMENGKKPVGTGRLQFINGNYYIDKIIIIKEERNKKYGDFIIRLLINKGFLSGAKEIILDSPKHLVLYLEKIGFKIVNKLSNNVEKGYICMNISPKNVCRECSNN